VRDFDKAGFIIAGTLARDTRRYEFSNVDHADRVSDLGLRLADVEVLDIPAEDVFYGKTDPRANLLEYGATDDEVEFLCSGVNWGSGGYFGQRVELNAMTSGNLINFLEGKLNDLGISKVIPGDATLEQAYRRAAEAHYINKHSREILSKRHSMQNRLTYRPTFAPKSNSGCSVNPLCRGIRLQDKLLTERNCTKSA